MAGRILAEALFVKICESTERTAHLVSLVPDENLHWRPNADADERPLMELGELLGHLLDCAAGFCACFAKAFPGRWPAMEKLEALSVNHFCGPREALTRLDEYRLRIKVASTEISDEDLKRCVPTVFVAEGEPLITLLLGNLEHLSHHKYQLFLYLRMLGLKVGTADLYQLRGQ